MAERYTLEVSEDKKLTWVHNGRLYGYPECCIKDFLIVVLPRRDSVFSGTGFIPCEECCKRDPLELVEEIAKNRKVAGDFKEIYKLNRERVLSLEGK